MSKSNCKHEFIKTAGKKSKNVTYFCFHCPARRTEAVIIHNEDLMNSYKEFIDELIQFSELTRIS